MKNPSFINWVGWIGATVAAALIGCAYVYATFQTKDEAKENKSDIVQRLDRIENKVDEIRARK